MKPTRKYLLPISIFLSCISPKLFSQAPANFNFELSTPGSYTTANAVPGWTVESAVNTMSFGGFGCVPNPSIVWTQGSPEFSVITTPLLSPYPFYPQLLTLPNSPLGGMQIVKLNNSSVPNPYSALSTRLKTQLQVTNTCDLLKLAFAGSFDGAHQCCEQPVFRIDFYSCSVTPSLIPSLSRTLTPSSGQCLGVPGFWVVGSVSLIPNWFLLDIDLSPYLGQCLELVITVADCAYGGHHGSGFIDLSLTSWPLWYTGSGIVPTGSGNAVSFCPGSNQATIQGPPGYSNYQWIAPGNLLIPPPQGTSQVLSVSNPSSNSVYTLLSSSFNFTTQHTYTITPSQVNIAGIGSFSTCNGGANGSATVVANGSGQGYTYQWLNQNNISVGTSSSVANLPGGTYSVVVSAQNNSLCGVSSSTIYVGTIPMPTVSAIPVLCKDAPIYTITAFPSGGYLSTNSNSLSSYQVQINPATHTIGSYSYTYSINYGYCLSQYTSTYQIGGPAISLQASTVQLCSSQSLTLHANGANSYTWSTGALSSSIVVSPTINTTYSVTGSHSVDACLNTSTVFIQVLPSPNLQITGNTSVCALQSTTLTASGANSYTWSTGSFNNSIHVTPSITTTITVMGSSPLLSCISHQSILLNVIPGPPLQISGPTLVCEGQPFSLAASGANSYTWFASTSAWTNANNGSTLTLTQAGTNTYSLNASSSMSLCNSYTTITVYTMPCLGLDDNPKFSSLFKIYPNPSSGLFFIESVGETEIEVFNSLGQMVLQKTILEGKQNIDLSEQAAGVYFVRSMKLLSSQRLRIIKID